MHWDRRNFFQAAAAAGIAAKGGRGANANPTLLDTALVAPACDPGATGDATPITEMQPLLDDAPVRFGLNR
jgi:hypothetical protein